jgi:hypothetical protein
MGGYQPRRPDSTIITGFGDCKDKATLFIAAMQHLGLKAYPVLLNSNGVKETEVVSSGLFDHAIAAYPSRDPGGLTFLDLTSSSNPPGTLPRSYQGGFGLVVMPDGTGKEITFPEEAAGSATTAVIGEISADGKLKAEFSTTGTDAVATSMRSGFVEPLDSARRAQMKRFAGSAFPGAVIDTVTTTDGKDRTVAPRLMIRFHDAEGFKRTGSVAIMNLPNATSGNTSMYNSMANTLADRGERKQPIDAERVVGDRKLVTHFEVTLPEGWKAQLPKSVDEKSVFGEYRAEFSQNGRVLTVQFTTIGAKGIYPKEKAAELAAWLKAVAAASVTSIALIGPPTP